MTNKDYIKAVLKGNQLTCSQICFRIAQEKEVVNSKQFSASISSSLRKMIMVGEIIYVEGAKGPQGGHVYTLNN